MQNVSLATEALGGIAHSPSTTRNSCMKITRLEVFALRAPAPERPHWTSHFIVPTANEILVRLYTDEGI